MFTSSRPPNNDLKLGELDPEWKAATKDWREELHDEIKAISPNLILALGNTALKALSGKDGIKKWRGSILLSVVGPKMISTYHPAHLLRPKDSEVQGFWQRHVVQLDFQRAAKESEHRRFEPPSRNLFIAKNSLDVHRFLHAKEGLLSVDIESHNCLPICVGFATSPYDAISIPLMDKKMSIAERMEIWRYVARALIDPKWKKIGQNFKYDEPKLNMFGFYLDKLHADTMLMMHTCYPELPQSLAFQTSILTREPFYKDDGKDWEGTGRIEDLFTYNARDAAVTFECYLRLREELVNWKTEDFYFGFVNKLHKFYSQIDEVGFRADTARRALLILEYESLRDNAQSILNKIFGETVNIDSHVKFRKLFFEKLKLPERGDLGEDTLVALLGNHAKSGEQQAAINLILNLRRYNKTLDTYLLAFPDFDGKIRTNYRITGTETGRSSTSKQKPPVRPYQMGLSFHNITKHGDIGNEIRSFLLPEEGYLLFEVDCRQAEARVVCVLAEAYDLLEKFDTLDIHKWTAALIFGKDIGAISDDERFIGKTVRHAGNYDAGKNRLMNTIISDSKRLGVDIHISEWKAGVILERFHNFTPEIRGIFHRQVRDVVEQTKILRNPFGRVRQFFGPIDDHTVKEAYANLPQGTIPDHLRRAALAAKEEAPNLKFIVESHDGLTGQVKEDEADDILRMIQSHLLKPINFGECSLSRDFNLTIPVDFKLGENYRDLEKYKLKED